MSYLRSTGFQPPKLTSDLQIVTLNPVQIVRHNDGEIALWIGHVCKKMILAVHLPHTGYQCTIGQMIQDTRMSSDSMSDALLAASSERTS
jgi:hypothetical protein